MTEENIKTSKPFTCTFFLLPDFDCVPFSSVTGSRPMAGMPNHVPHIFWGAPNAPHIIVSNLSNAIRRSFKDSGSQKSIA